jgi:hypothetical protein
VVQNGHDRQRIRQKELGLRLSSLPLESIWGRYINKTVCVTILGDMTGQTWTDIRMKNKACERDKRVRLSEKKEPQR